MGHSVFTTERDSLSSVLLGLLPSNVRRSVSLQSSYPLSAAGIPRPPSAGSILPPPRVLRCNRILRRLRSSLRFWLQSWPFSFTPVKSSLSLSRQPSFDRRRTAGLFPLFPRFSRFSRFSCLRRSHPLLALLLLAAALVSLWDVEFVVEIEAVAWQPGSPGLCGETSSQGTPVTILYFHSRSSFPHLPSLPPALSRSLHFPPFPRHPIPLEAVAARAAITKQWQREPPGLWEEPPEALQWRPCALADSSLSAPAASAATHSASHIPRRGAGSDGAAAAGGGSRSSNGDSSSGGRADAGPFFSVAAKGGLSQLRVATCNAAAVALYLNATLLLPRFLSFSSASSGRAGLAALAPLLDLPDVAAVAAVPIVAVVAVGVSEKQFPREVPLQLFLRLVPLMRRVGLLHFHGFLNALASDPMPLHVQWVCSLHFQCFLTSLASHALPLHIQRLRCRCMFHALTFLPAVHATAQLAIQRLRSAAGVLPRVQEQWMDGEDEAGNRGAGNGENQGKKYEREKMEGQVESQVRAQVKGQVNDTSGQVQSDIGHVGPREPEPPAGIPRYVAAHIPFDAVSAAYSLCSFTARHHHNDYHNQTQDQNQHDNQYEQQGQGQERDEAEEELEEVRDIRRLLFPVLHAYEQQGRLNAPDWYRRIGRCPVAPEEAALVLAGMGVGRMRPLFLVGVSAEPCSLVLGGESVLSGGDGGMQGGREEEWREEEGWRGAAWEQEEQEGRMRAQQEQQLRGPGRRWFNGCRRLEAVRALFPFLLSIDTLLSPLEIAPYSHSPLLITALETIVASESDLFLAADGSSQLAALVAGRRMYFGSRSDKKSGYQHGYRPSVRINRAQLAEDLGGGKDLRAGEEWIGDAEERIMEWEEVEERVRAMVGESKSVRKRRVSRSVYRHPRDEACMCFGEGGKRGEEVGSEEWGGTGEERGRKKKLQGREVRGGGLGRADVGRSGDTGSGKGLDDGGRWEEKGEIRAKRRVGKDGGSNGPAKRQRLRGVVGGRGVSVGVDDDDEEDEGEDGVESGESNMDRDEEEREVERTIRLDEKSKQRHVAPIRAASSGSGGNGDSNKEKPAMQSLYDLGSNLLTRVLSGGDMSGMPTASGEVSDLVGRPLFFALHNWFLELGGVYRLAFGPKAFVVISDPVVARHVLKENPFAYDKGMLAELLEPIMGKGLIPADFDTWKQRRRAIVPGFHAAYLEAMALVFSECSKRSVDKLQALCDQAGAAAGGEGVRMDMESEYSSIALDIIGISVFNYDFGSVTRESPVIKAVYGTLSEAEHRATFYIPYWNIPFISLVVPRQMKFQQDLKVINDCLDDLITRARATRQEDDLEALQQRDYSKVRDASLLRFLVDLRGEDCDDKQLRDDLMTMLVAGHETTAAVLTWATYMLSQHPRVLARLQEEVDAVLGDRLATLQDIKSLEYTRLVVSEALRLYPQPPLLIRRALANDHLPSGYKGNPEGYNLPKGTDLFVSVFNINRSPHYWENPEEFRPERFLERRSGDGIPGWDGYDPDRLAGALYPNEVVSDFAFLPFGGGPRKCVGDQFALMESTVALAMILRRFNVRLDGPPEDTEMVMGATMHTKSGLWCRLTPRGDTDRPQEKGLAADAAGAAANA
ncbi:unnamed protein product [Closterium sp. NIES-64]|nr:unnamed protein product [Closterium sp. NIES-64]